MALGQALVVLPSYDLRRQIVAVVLRSIPITWCSYVGSPQSHSLRFHSQRVYELTTRNSDIGSPWGRPLAAIEVEEVRFGLAFCL